MAIYSNPETTVQSSTEEGSGPVAQAVHEFANDGVNGELARPTGSYIVRAGLQPAHYVLSGSLAAVLQRGDSVVCRTPRGLELADVLTEVRGEGLSDAEDLAQAKYLRRAREDDLFLMKKLESLSQDAGRACQLYLESTDSTDVLVEVEPLLDGRTLFFHFLGELTGSTEAEIDRLADAYQTTVSRSRFAALVERGCGPGCGTKEKGGCGTNSSCAVCAIAGGCTSTKRSSK